MDDELAQIIAFRNRFVAYANLVAPFGWAQAFFTGHPWP